ncbi:flippase [Halobaculum rarum]|uniref:flippase n=1 Tax=Halobaculum rarum TaxID=3075122 RepID=UPI0032AF1078
MDIARSSLKLFVSRLATTVIGFLGITFFARELTSGIIGVFFLFEALLGILAIPADFGLRGSVEKRMSEGDTPGAYLAAAILLKLGPLTLIVLGISVFSATINSYLGAEVAHLLAAAIVLQEVGMLSMEVLKGELRVGETAIIGFIRQGTWFTVAWVLVNNGFGAVGLIYGLLSGLVVMLLIGWYKLTVPLRWPSREQITSLVDYGKYNVISSIGGYFYNWMDVVIIGVFLTQSDVGAYELAWRVTSISILFSGAISTTIFPQVSKWDAIGSKERIEDLIPSVLTPSLVLVIPAFFGTLLFSQEILGLIFGAEYVKAWLVLILLMGDKVFQAVQAIIGRSLQAIDKPDLAARATVVSLVLNAVLNVMLIIEFGIIGAALATVISSLVNDGLHFFYLRKFIRIRLPTREIIECFGASLGMAGVLYILTQLYHVDSLLKLISVIILGVILYTFFVLLSPTLGTKMQETVKEIRQAT